MKKSLAITSSLLLLLLGGYSLKAQEQKATLKPYGFFRSYAFFDSRATKSLTEDMFFFVPLDSKVVGGNDVNAVSSFNYQAITTRVGLDVTGYKIGQTAISGKVEADFYCLNSSGNTGTLRMRQAYVDLAWNGRGDKGTTDMTLRIGQAWHPLAADMAHGINLETAAPFSPFNRSAQLMFGATFSGKTTLNAGLLQQLQYRSNGPAGSTNKYQRHAVPELYLGLSYKDGGFLGRVGVDVLSIRPQYGYDANGKKYDEWLTTVTPFIYLQYTKGLFQVKAKSVLAQAGEHMQLNGGYAATSFKSDGISYEYAPIRSSVNFVSFQYGKQWQVLGMIGYQRNLGTATDIMTDKIYFSGNGFSNILQMVRFTPTVAYNLGKFQFALEYDYTTVQYGSNLSRRALAQDNLHWVGNSRILSMVKFTF